MRELTQFETKQVGGGILPAVPAVLGVASVFGSAVYAGWTFGMEYFKSKQP